MKLSSNLRPIFFNIASQIFKKYLLYYFNYFICFNFPDHRAYGFSTPKDHQVITAIEYQGRVPYWFSGTVLSERLEGMSRDVVFLSVRTLCLTPHSFFCLKCHFHLEDPFCTSSRGILDIRWNTWCKKKVSDYINYLQHSKSNLWNWEMEILQSFQPARYSK